MPELSEYLNVETLQQLQDAFSAVSQAPIRICGPDGAPLTARSSVAPASPGQGAAERPLAGADAAEARAPIMVNDRTVGHVAIDSSPGAEPTTIYPRHLRLMALVTGVISRLCQREEQLRTRVDELATLYRLTGEFAGQRNLQDLLDLVAKTVVAAMSAKACSIRLLTEDGSELLLKAVANLSQQYLNKGPILLRDSEIDREALTAGEPVYMADLATDPRVLYPAEAEREGIVSGLCAPMIYRGRPEGAIRVYMGERHDFDWFEISLVKAIAAEAAAAIANSRLLAESVRSANMQRQLRLAGEVQRRMIPTRVPKLPGFDIAAIYVPCFELAGDFYDFLPLPGENLGLAVCDVVGKGVRASLLTASIRASLRAHASSIYDMSEVVGRVNRDLCADTLAGDFATLFYGVIDGPRRVLTYVVAGHIPPVLVRKGLSRRLEARDGVLGLDPNQRWHHATMDLEPADAILLHTDGINEALNFEDESFGLRRVEESVKAAVDQGFDADGVAKHVLWEMRRFAGLQTRLDDLTLVAIRVL